MRRRSPGKADRKVGPAFHASRPRLSFLSFLAGFILLALAGNVFLSQYLLQERTIYSWDYSAYEFKFVEAVQAFQMGPAYFLRAVLDSIAHTDNSLLVPSLLAPWGAAFGTDRVYFILLVFNLLAIPSLLILSIFFSRWTGSGRLDWVSLLPAALAVVNPFFWIPLVRGFYDIATWMVLLLVWALVLGEGKKIPWSKALAVGVLLAALIFMRRWLGYWSLSLPLSLGILWVAGKLRREKPIWGPGPIALTCAAGFAVFLVFAPHWIAHVWTEDPAALYGAYKRDLSTFGSAWKGISDLSLFSWTFAGAGAWLAWREVRLRKGLVLLLLQSLLALTLFARVQNLDPHHHLPLVLLLVLLQSLFLLLLWKGSWGFPAKAAGTALFALGAWLNFTQSLVPGAPQLKAPFHLLVEEKAPPLRRGDLGEIQRLIDTLGTRKARGIYLLSGSQEMNATTLQNAAYYLRFEDHGTCSKILFTSTVDVRDGFPWDLFRADLVLVADPVPYQLSPKDQSVIGLPAEDLLKRKGIGKGFRKLPEEFHLDGGVTLKVFQRTGKIKFEDVSSLNRAIQGMHPGCGKFSRETFQKAGPGRP